MMRRPMFLGYHCASGTETETLKRHKRPGPGTPAQPSRAERHAQVNRAGAGTLRASWAAREGVGMAASS